jgi:hypothetical protein
MRTLEMCKADLAAGVARADQIEARLKSDLPPATRAALRTELEALEAKMLELAREHTSLKVDAAIKRIGADMGVELPGDGAGTGDLAGALLDAGFDVKRQPFARVPVDTALRLKTGSVDGGVDEHTVPVRREAPALGFDQRWAYPNFRRVPVEPDQTGIQSYRQKSRSLAATSDMIRAIDAVTEKPETSSVAEVLALELKQIAHKQKNTPNVLLENRSFRSWVDSDLRLGFQRAVDAHIVEQVAAASIPSGGGGANAFEDILYSQEVVREAGYDPSLVLVSPADALAIQLLQLEDGVTYAFAQRPPTMVATPAVADGEGFVCDPSAIGELHLGDFTLRAFEENAGQTNSSTVRGESSGLFVVQREDAAATLASGS